MLNETKIHKLSRKCLRDMTLEEIETDARLLICFELFKKIKEKYPEIRKHINKTIEILCSTPSQSSTIYELMTQTIAKGTHILNGQVSFTPRSFEKFLRVIFDYFPPYRKHMPYQDFIKDFGSHILNLCDDRGVITNRTLTLGDVVKDFVHKYDYEEANVTLKRIYDSFAPIP